MSYIFNDKARLLIKKIFALISESAVFTVYSNALYFHYNLKKVLSICTSMQLLAPNYHLIIYSIREAGGASSKQNI